MTPTQVEVINQLKTKILADDAKGSPDFEYKTFHVQEYVGEKWVCLWTITGHHEDQGTLAEALYRKQHLYWIGPRGRVLLLNDPVQYQQPVLSLDTALKEPYKVKAGRGRARSANDQHGAGLGLHGTA